MDKLAQSLRGKIEEMLDPPTSGSTAADVTLIDVPDHPFGILRCTAPFIGGSMSHSPIPGRSESQQKQRAVVFVTDAGFLVPTLVAALDVCAQHAVTSAADVVVLLIDFTEDVREGLSAEFTATGMDFLCLKSAQFLPPENVFFNKTHVPRTALGRFAIDDVLPENYLHILYLDGDVRVIGDISPLVLHDVAPGYIAAANEYLWLCENDRGAFWQRHHAYLKNIGISNPGDYFNSGVLAFRRDTWKTMSRKALEYFNRHADICLYHDQSALNAVFNGRREILPLSYNFGTKYADLGLENTVKPRIIHFTGGCKPWFFSGKPWNGRFIQDYKSLLLKHPFLKAYWKVPSAADLSAMVATDKRMRRRSALLTPWRTTVKKARFRRYQEATPFQV